MGERQGFRCDGRRWCCPDEPSNQTPGERPPGRIRFLEQAIHTRSLVRCIAVSEAGTEHAISAQDDAGSDGELALFECRPGQKSVDVATFVCVLLEKRRIHGFRFTVDDVR